VNILIIAGEISGDLYASYLAAELKKQKNCTLFAIGGEKLNETCDHLIFESTHDHGIGIETKFTKRNYKKKLLNCIKSLLSSRSITKIIIVDFQHYNDLIAKLIPKEIPIYTFITPNFWMWKSMSQAKKVTTYSTKIFNIFEQEHAFYKPLSKSCYYFGHPLTEILDTTPINAPTTPPQITLLPGSRPQEFKLYFLTMLNTLLKLQHSASAFTLVICVSSKQYLNIIESYLKKFPKLNYSLSYNVTTTEIKKSTLVIAASGSTTLEVILLNKPLIVLAALPKLSYFLAKYILRIKLPFISLPNFIAQKEIVPELVQSQITVPNLYKTIINALQKPTDNLKLYSNVYKKLVTKKKIFKNIAEEIMK
jgi:lipid-A-disaccharide synthase